MADFQIIRSENPTSGPLPACLGRRSAKGCARPLRPSRRIARSARKSAV